MEITFYRIHTMWANYYNELFLTLEKPNKGYVRLASRLQDVLWLRWGSRALSCEAPLFRDHRINQVKSSSNMNIHKLIEENTDGDEGSKENETTSN